MPALKSCMKWYRVKKLVLTLFIQVTPMYHLLYEIQYKGILYCRCNYNTVVKPATKITYSTNPRLESRSLLLLFSPLNADVCAPESGFAMITPEGNPFLDTIGNRIPPIKSPYCVRRPCVFTDEVMKTFCRYSRPPRAEIYNLGAQIAGRDRSRRCRQFMQPSSTSTHINTWTQANIRSLHTISHHHVVFRWVENLSQVPSQDFRWKSENARRV